MYTMNVRTMQKGARRRDYIDASGAVCRGRGVDRAPLVGTGKFFVFQPFIRLLCRQELRQWLARWRAVEAAQRARDADGLRKARFNLDVATKFFAGMVKQRAADWAAAQDAFYR